MTKKSLFLIIILTTIGISPLLSQPSKDFNQLINWMTGKYTLSENSASADSGRTEKWVFDRIWNDKPNGAWFLANQYPSVTSKEPFSQKVYFVSELGDGQFSCDIYRIPGSDDSLVTAVGLKEFTPFDLKYRDGCTVFLNYDGFQYYGKTNAETCRDSTGDTTYKVVEMIFTPGSLKFAERTYDEGGKQIRGTGEELLTFRKEKE